MKYRILLLIALVLTIRLADAQEKKPNIIVFLVDDLGWNDTSLPLSGQKTKYNQRYRTPNLEHLASEGVTFTHAYSNAFCVPSRVSLLTGQNVVRHQVTGDIETTESEKHTLLVPPGRVIKEAEYMLPNLLKKNGYYTIIAGKYHACHICPSTISPTPEAAGFMKNIGASGWGAPGSYNGLDSFQNQKHNEHQPYPGLEKYFGKDIYMTEALTNESLVAMKSAVEKKQPFFMYLAHYGVHTPIQVQKPYRKNYSLTPGEPEEEAAYATMIEGVDVSLGRIMKALDDWHISDNTLLIFYSDNGGRVLWRGKKSLYGDYEFNYPLRSGKASLYEGGTSVPCVVRWPNKAKAKLHVKTPLMIEDLYSTVLQAANVNPPTNYAIDGKSWLNLLNGKGNSAEFNQRQMFFLLPYRFEGTTYNGYDFAFGGVQPATSVIEGDWKLIYFFQGERFELYNLKTDRAEKNNLVNQELLITTHLVELMDKNMREKKVNVLPLLLPEKKPVTWPLTAWHIYKSKLNNNHI